ncbi:hypothetical protein [Streptomyces hokutonensis]|uniref:hypothetical protein n=1 Tax=Streptomyces hokutonensis TaxID=1306990 RepID=UPI00039DAD7E|nr:hypothetical protein [Streptomyces hokutonensis]
MTTTLEEWVRHNLAEHTEKYVAAHGQHPLAECFEWARAIERWQHQHPELRGDFGQVDPAVDRGLLTTAIAENLRLSLVVQSNSVLGDLDLDRARCELWRWTRTATEHPAPGSVHWPAPPAPYDIPWRALMLDVPADERRRVVMSATAAMTVLADSVTALLPTVVFYRRLDEAGITYTALAQAAPVLGITHPTAVSNPRFCAGIEGLTVTAQDQPL